MLMINWNYFRDLWNYYGPRKLCRSKFREYHRPRLYTYLSKKDLEKLDRSMREMGFRGEETNSRKSVP